MKLLLFFLLFVFVFAQEPADGDAEAADADAGDADAGAEEEEAEEIIPPEGGAKFFDYSIIDSTQRTPDVILKEIKKEKKNWDGVNILIFYDMIKTS